MTILKTIDGREIDTAQFKGYGEFTRYVQEHIDRNFGKNTTANNKWVVTISGKKNVVAYIKVEATTEKEAGNLALKKAESKPWEIDWEDSVNDDVDCLDVSECEEDEEDEDG